MTAASVFKGYMKRRLSGLNKSVANVARSPLFGVSLIFDLYNLLALAPWAL